MIRLFYPLSLSLSLYLSIYLSIFNLIDIVFLLRISLSALSANTRLPMLSLTGQRSNTLISTFFDELLELSVSFFTHVELALKCLCLYLFAFVVGFIFSVAIEVSTVAIFFSLSFFHVYY